MAHNRCNYSTPQGNAIRWLAEEDNLELYPADSGVLVQSYSLAVIFYATAGKGGTTRLGFTRLVSFQKLTFFIGMRVINS